MKRGPYKGRKQLFREAVRLRRKGYGYRAIGSMLNIPWRTVSGWISYIKIDSKAAHRRATQLRLKPISALQMNTCRRRRLIQRDGHRCSNCRRSKWLKTLIPLEIDHIDGNKRNNEERNLRLLCPNCHVFTPTYKGRNIKRARGGTGRHPRFRI